MNLKYAYDWLRDRDLLDGVCGKYVLEIAEVFVDQDTSEKEKRLILSLFAELVLEMIEDEELD
jgi:hypothetical protein